MFDGAESLEGHPEKFTSGPSFEVRRGLDNVMTDYGNVWLWTCHGGDALHTYIFIIFLIIVAVAWKFVVSCTVSNHLYIFFYYFLRDFFKEFMSDAARLAFKCGEFEYKI